MKSVRSHQEEEEDEDIVSRKETPSDSKDGKNNDKASAMRSKHSVTEHRRRCRINERFQILRDLVPHRDQKRDTASFLLEVIDYVQFLQENVQKYEGSYQGWSSETTKLMPWRNSHWRVHSLVGPTQAIKNDSGPLSTFPVRFDDNDVTISPTTYPRQLNPIESDPSRFLSGKIVDQQPELANKFIDMPMPLQASVSSSGPGDRVIPHPPQRPFSDAQSTECPTLSETLNQHEDLIIEGGTISLTSLYSEGLLNNLTQALQSAGVDLSQATVSVQIDLGKQANKRMTSGVSNHKDTENSAPSHLPSGHFRDLSDGEELGQAQKRMKM